MRTEEERSQAEVELNLCKDAADIGFAYTQEVMPRLLGWVAKEANRLDNSPERLLALCQSLVYAGGKLEAYVRAQTAPVKWTAEYIYSLYTVGFNHGTKQFDEVMEEFSKQFNEEE